MPASSADRKQRVVTELRRAEILEGATKVFADKGFDATRMEEIAKAAGLAKGTLYRYFRSKDAVYQATVQHAISKLNALTDEHVGKEVQFARKLDAFIAVRIAFWNEHQKLYRIILSINRQERHRNRSFAWQKEAVAYLVKMFANACKAGEIPHQDFLSAAWTTIDAIRGVNERHAFFAARASREKTKFLREFLLNALGARTGSRS